MKKYLLISVCFLIISHARAQQLSKPLTQKDYLLKSRKQKTAAWLLVSGGITIFTITGIIASDNLDLSWTYQTNQTTSYTVPLVVSGIFVAGSVPLFIAAAHNKSLASEHSETYFSQKSRNQRTLAWILLGSGAGLSTLGLSQHKFQDKNLPYKSGLSGTDVVGITGAAAALTSIPLFISSAKNRQKATHIGISSQKLIIPKRNSVIMTSQPAIAMTVDF